MIGSVAIIGAGSIGNHMAHASRHLGWQVAIGDIDPDALRRTQEDIYPGRYGAWDEAIELRDLRTSRLGAADLVIIGTPPDSHMTLAQAAIDAKPAAMLVEKPLCTPNLDGLDDLLNLAERAGVRLFVGYDHVVGAAAEKAAELLAEGAIGDIQTIDVEFREEWSGIFAAHPWLDGPADSYLGYWRRGGGSTGEHSHALNLWQFLARCVGAGNVARVSATMTMVQRDGLDYDALSAMTLTSETGLVGRVIQDVVTAPPRKWARVQGRTGAIEWHCGWEPGLDAVIVELPSGDREIHQFAKTRPDDFIRELSHIDRAMSMRAPSPLDIEHGAQTMHVIAAAHRARAERRAIDLGQTPATTG